MKFLKSTTARSFYSTTDGELYTRCLSLQLWRLLTALLNRFDAKNITPRAEFGFGLSFTNFSYASLGIKSTDLKKRNNGGSSTSNLGLYDDAYTISFDVKNSGGVDGHEVSQVYLVSRVPLRLGGEGADFPDASRDSPSLLESLRRS